MATLRGILRGKRNKPPAAAGRGQAVDRDDDRLGALALNKSAKAATCGLHSAWVGAHRLEIGASAENPALFGLGARQNADPEVVIGSGGYLVHDTKGPAP